MRPLTETERAYFDTIRQVATSARPEDLALARMTLDGKEVAVVIQRVVESATADEVGWMPLAILVDDDTAARLRDHTGAAPESHDATGLEGAGS